MNALSIIPSAMHATTDQGVNDAYHLSPTFHEVVIVGASVSAIAMAIQLERKLGVTDTLLLEKETNLGGTWHQNTCVSYTLSSFQTAFRFALRQEELTELVYAWRRSWLRMRRSNTLLFVLI